MKKALALTLSAALAAGMFAGCSASSASGQETSGGTSDGETVVLKFWKASIDETRKAWWEETFDRFEAEHPGIEVEFLGVPGDVSAFNQKLDMAVAGNDAPDIISANLDTAYITRGLLEPLDEYYNAWEGKDGIAEKYLTPFYAMDYASETPKLYAAPTGGSVECMYVRPDLLAAQGLEAPETWDDFFTAAEKTTNTNEGVYGYVIRGGAGSATALGTQMYSYSGITDYFIDGVCTVNDPKNVEYAEKFFGAFGTWTSEDDITKGWPEMAAQFQAGKAALLIHNLGSAKDNYAAFDNDTSKVEAAPLPLSVTGKRVIPAVRPAGNMMMASSEHKEEAWILMQWLLEPEQDSAYHELMSNLPLNTESLEADWIQNTSYMKMGADVAQDPNTEVCNVPYYLPNYSSILTSYVEPGIQSVLLGDMTAQELLDGWAELLQEDYDALMG